MQHCSLNYDYVLERALSLSPVARPDVLDFGCGTGNLLHMAAEQGFAGTLYGADTFADHYKNWADAVPEQHRQRIRRIENGRVPFDDASFDIVVANQVFEHVPEPAPALDEINRVLRPGGAFLALFPTSDVWFEGHLGLYFVHWLQAWPGAQHAYCRLSHAAGFGLYRGNETSERWATRSQTILRNACVYHDARDVRRWWRKAFGTEPVSLADDYMAFRLAHDARLKRLQPFGENPAGRALLRAICRMRVGQVLLVRKPS
jgi:SAM-dependent methyltransferase